ncbi:carcinoembryonic antigen-related cell adhesion molecule 3-like [Emys orbicularis]|uniref:carcinoembryonic antigen-related cell adhesion molecule 3-like n=1 Tax=Emys orbicularis TaxID=82168 RepID=UPI0031FC1442
MAKPLEKSSTEPLDVPGAHGRKQTMRSGEQTTKLPTARAGSHPGQGRAMGRRPGGGDPPAWGSPWTGLLLAASVLGSCLQPAPAQTPVTIVITPPSPVVGGDVSLAPQNLPQDFVVCSWYRTATTYETNRILTYFPPPNPVQQNGSAHTGRETAGPGCTLNIAGLMLNDTGNYTVLIQSPTSLVPYITVHLFVSGLPPGTIAGIVIGSLAGAALLGGLLYFLLRKTGGERLGGQGTPGAGGCPEPWGPKQRPPVGGQAEPAHSK